jgi:hypothetical protein
MVATAGPSQGSCSVDLLPLTVSAGTALSKLHTALAAHPQVWTVLYYIITLNHSYHAPMLLTTLQLDRAA